MIKTELMKQMAKYSPVPKNMGELAEIKKGVYRFSSEAYRLEGIGNLFYMQMSAMFGLMKMETAVITPIEKDLSFCNMDTIAAAGNQTYLFEMYRTCINDTDLSSFAPVHEKYSHLTDSVSGPHWYDSLILPATVGKKGKKIAAEGEAMLKECLAEYIRLLDQAPACAPDTKKEKVAEYVDQLISRGGPAVDSMKKIIGEEKTAKLIRTFMYGLD